MEWCLEEGCVQVPRAPKGRARPLAAGSEGDEDFTGKTMLELGGEG